MFELPDYTGRDPEYVKNSLTFFIYHAEQTLSGKKRSDALEVVRVKATQHGIELE